MLKDNGKEIRKKGKEAYNQRTIKMSRDKLVVGKIQPWKGPGAGNSGIPLLSLPIGFL